MIEIYCTPTATSYLVYFTHLGNNGKSASEVMESQGRNINTIDQDSAFCSLNYAKQTVGQTRFACASSSNNANLGENGKKRRDDAEYSGHI